MPAYLIVIRNEPVRDEAEMAEYQRQTRLIPPSVPIRPKVVYGALTPVEGTPPDAVVMVEFDTVSDAQAWYGSPGYQDAVAHRLNAADYTSFIVEGL